ncbi:MAG TPA: multicopper oxidase domain-containing protein [Gemmatimonadales bacterium]|nr:multicopper oxidase domain-containing protein [Gemmatimonadales bacterium]
MIWKPAVALATMGGLLIRGPLDQAAPDPISHGAIERIQANPNIHPAGRLSGRTLTLALEARNGRWYPMAEGGLSVETMAFAEGSGPLLIPGPLIRVPSGTEVRVSVRNRLAVPLVIHGLTARPVSGDDSLIVPPRGTGEARFRVNEPGSYYYWGSTSGLGIGDRDGLDSQLNGAIIVDPPGSVVTDRVFMIGVWFRPADTSSSHPVADQDIMTINGKSWPHTEQFTFTQGDTVHWRWINPSASSHPMHLHGFYFQVESRGDGQRDTSYAPDRRPREVTELMLPGGTMLMNWVPERTGNWLFHCHFSFHVSPDASLADSGFDESPATGGSGHTQHRHRMSGLVLGLHVTPGTGTPAAQPPPQQARDIRLLVQTQAHRFGPAPGYGYVIQTGSVEPARDSIVIPGAPLLLERDQPVRIKVVNHLAQPTAVHWHGIELQSYPDGVPDWSGAPGRLMPPVVPGDSFVAEFTPPRAGTFIYHAHLNELEQMHLGLYGPLIVLEPGTTFDPATDHIVIVSPDGPSTDSTGGLLNGSKTPEPILMRVGTVHRLRLINIHGDYRVLFTLESRGGPVEWRQLAKDGAAVATGLAGPQPARLLTGPGDTADFELRPDTAGDLVLNVQAPFAEPPWKLSLPIRVIPDRAP